VQKRAKQKKRLSCIPSTDDKTESIKKREKGVFSLPVLPSLPLSLLGTRGAA
jgi:hypothetical protein